MAVCKNCGAAVACPGDPQSLTEAVKSCPLDKGKLVVHVVDLAGNDIPDVNLTVRTETGPITDPTGFFTRDPLDPGPCAVQVTACRDPQFEVPPDTQRAATISAGQMSLLTFELPAWVEVEVVDEDGQPLADLDQIEVSVTLPGGTVRQLQASDLRANVYRVGELKPGSCKVALPKLHDRDWKGA